MTNSELIDKLSKIKDSVYQLYLETESRFQDIDMELQDVIDELMYNEPIKPRIDDDRYLQDINKGGK